jgi:hypothetical protein
MRREGDCRRLELQCHGSAAVKESPAVGPSHRGWVDYLLMTFQTSDIYSSTSTIYFDAMMRQHSTHGWCEVFCLMVCTEQYVCSSLLSALRSRLCCCLLRFQIIWCIEEAFTLADRNCILGTRTEGADINCILGARTRGRETSETENASKMRGARHALHHHRSSAITEKIRVIDRKGRIHERIVNAVVRRTTSTDSLIKMLVECQRTKPN